MAELPEIFISYSRRDRDRVVAFRILGRLDLWSDQDQADKSVRAPPSPPLAPSVESSNLMP